MTTATKSRKKTAPPLRGGNSNKPPSDEPLVPNQEANGKPDPQHAGEAVKTVVNRVKKELDGHVNDGDWQQQRDDDLQEIYNRREEALARELLSKHRYAADKKDREAIDGELLIAVRDRHKKYPPRPQKLFDDPDDPKSKKKAEPSKNGVHNPPADDESWRTVPLSSLNLPKGILKTLENPVDKRKGSQPPIKTIGDYQNYLKPRDGWEPNIKDLKGMGEAKAEQVEAALMEFWKTWKPAEKEKPVDKSQESTEKQNPEDLSTKEKKTDAETPKA